MDAMHTRCIDFKTITAFVFHPLQRTIHQIACMESEKENTEAVALFLNLINQMCAEVKGVRNYKLNVSAFLTDEDAAYKKGIRQVLG